MNVRVYYVIFITTNNNSRPTNVTNNYYHCVIVIPSMLVLLLVGLQSADNGDMTLFQNCISFIVPALGTQTPYCYCVYAVQCSTFFLILFSHRNLRSRLLSGNKRDRLKTQCAKELLIRGPTFSVF